MVLFGADDVAVPNGTGLVGGQGMLTQTVTHTNDHFINVDDGSGISGTTSLGDMTVSATHFYDGGHASSVSDGTILVRIRLQCLLEICH